MTAEREVKLGVWPGFTMPDLDGLAEGAVVERVPSQRLDATYHDTPTLALARAGITLRFRTGDAGGDVWTLKLPAGSTGDVLVRDEIDVPGSARAVPPALLDEVAAWIRSARLAPIARLQTDRARWAVHDADGKPLAEIVDDEVSVLDGRHVALRFREVEVELAPEAGEQVMGELVSRLRAAGAGPPDPTPKVVRALGPRAVAPADLVERAVPKDAAAAEVLRCAVTRAVLRIVRNDAGARRGDMEAVHQARVGTRRLRSDLHTFEPVLDPAWTSGLRDELAWLAGLLGDVRDADVLRERLAADIAGLSAEDARRGEEILAALESQRDRARGALLKGLRSNRYASLLDRLVDAARDPRILPEASRPAAEVLPTLAARPWRTLAKSVKRAGDEPDDATLHGIRKRAKRARYAADVGALAVGKPASRFARAMADVQEVLGEHQDACVQREWLRAAAGALSPEAALVAGQLVARSDAVADAGRDGWRSAWKRADEGRLRAWLSR